MCFACGLVLVALIFVVAAELLTTNKLSELACLALYLMYEKKQGKESYWYPYIRELDRQRGRGQLAVESPLLWSQEEVDEYFAGSPMRVNYALTLYFAFLLLLLLLLRVLDPLVNRRDCYHLTNLHMQSGSSRSRTGCIVWAFHWMILG
jgi:hypothetical protein